MDVAYPGCLPKGGHAVDTFAALATSKPWRQLRDAPAFRKAFSHVQRRLRPQSANYTVGGHIDKLAREGEAV